MKKTFIVLLILAVAGGVFAQGWTFNGLIDSGFMLYFPDNGGPNDVYAAPITKEDTRGGRIQLEAHYVNEAKNAGLDFRFRGHNLTNNQDQTIANGLFHYGYGWVSFMEDLFRIQGGVINNHGGWATTDRMFDDRVGEGTGIQLILTPMDNFKIGFGAFAEAVDANSTLPLKASTLDKGPADKDGKFAQMKGSFNFAYTIPDMLKITGGVANRNDQAGNWTGTGTINTAGTAGSQQSHALLSVAYLGMKDLTAAFTARFMNFEDFGDYGLMRFYLDLGYKVTQELSVNLGFAPSFTNVDNKAADDTAFWTWFWVDFQIDGGKVTPRLDVHHLYAGTWANSGGEFSLHKYNARNGVTHNKDDHHLILRPSAQFRITNNAFAELGWNLDYDIEQEEARHGVYLLTSIKF